MKLPLPAFCLLFLLWGQCADLAGQEPSRSEFWPGPHSSPQFVEFGAEDKTVVVLNQGHVQTYNHFMQQTRGVMAAERIRHNVDGSLLAT